MISTMKHKFGAIVDYPSYGWIFMDSDGLFLTRAECFKLIEGVQKFLANWSDEDIEGRNQVQIEMNLDEAEDWRNEPKAQ